MEIVFKNVSYKNIFNNLNFDIVENEITAIIGKNGSGKSTLMNLIYGLDEYSGKINFEKDSKIQYVRQDFSEDLFNINIYEDIKYGNTDFDEKKLYEFLDKFNIDHACLKNSYLDLSDCDRKKILLIKAFVSNSKIILIDDIIRCLDGKSIDSLIQILKSEKRKNKIIIISSMNSDFLIRVVDKLIVLYDNKVIVNSDKYDAFYNIDLLNKINVSIPKIVYFKMLAQRKKIKLMYRDNINDLMKDIYRNAE